MGVAAEKAKDVAVKWLADREPQLQNDQEEGEDGHNLERSFLNLIDICDFEVTAARISDNLVTEQGSAKLFQVWKFTVFPENLALLKLERADVELAPPLPTGNVVMLTMMRELKTMRTQIIYTRLVLQGKLFYVLVDRGSSVILFNWILSHSLGFNGSLKSTK